MCAGAAYLPQPLAADVCCKSPNEIDPITGLVGKCLKEEPQTTPFQKGANCANNPLEAAAGVHLRVFFYRSINLNRSHE